MARDASIVTVTLNICHCAHCDLSVNPVATAIHSSGARVVGLQEVDCGLERSGHVCQPAALALQLARLTGEAWAYEFAPAAYPAYGNAVVFAVGAVGPDPVGSLRWTLPGDPTSDVSAYRETRSALGVELRGAARAHGLPGPLLFVTTHLGFGRTALAQLAALLAGLEGPAARGPGASVILCGDFNTYDRALSKSRDGDKDADYAELVELLASHGFADAGPHGTVFTFPVGPHRHPARKIDYVFVRGPVQVLLLAHEIRIVDGSKFTDHHGLRHAWGRAPTGAAAGETASG